MIIGIDASRAAANQRTGTEAYAFQLIRALIPQAAEHNHLVRLYFNQPHPDLFPAVEQVEIVNIPRPRLWTHVRLRQEMQRDPPDIFYTPAHVIPIGYRRPSVATVHDLGYHYFPEAHPRGQRTYLEWSTRHNGRTGRRIVADSQATKQDLYNLYGVPTAKIDVVYPGRDPDLGPVASQEAIETACAHYGIERPYLIYLGTLQPRKNLVRLVEAFALSGLAEANNTASHNLVLAGKAGWLAEDVMDAIEAQPYEVRQRITLTGYVDEDHKAALLSGATALVFPSLYEGFGFPVLEAQACDTAVLCSSTSSLPEVAGSAALLVDPLDRDRIAAGMVQLVKDSALRQQLITAGRANLLRFSWSQTAAMVLDTLERAYPH